MTDGSVKIAGEDYRHSMLQIYERAWGPPIGMDFAREAYLFGRTYRFIPPEDPEEQEILAHLFTQHLSQSSRFAVDLREWLETRQDRRTIATWAELIRSDEAKVRMMDAIYDYPSNLFHLMARFLDQVIVPLERALAVVKGLKDGSSKKERIRIRNAWGIFVSTLREKELARRSKEILRGIDNIGNEDFYKRAAYRLRDKHCEVLEDDETLRASYLAHSARNEATVLKYDTEDTFRFIYHIVSAEESQAFKTSRVMVRKLSRRMRSWYESYALIAFVAYRYKFLAFMDRVEREMLAPLRTKLSEGIELDELSRFVQSSYSYMDEQKSMGEVWDMHLNELYKTLEQQGVGAREILADVSYVIHRMRHWRTLTGGTLRGLQYQWSDATKVGSVNWDIKIGLEEIIKEWKKWQKGVLNDYRRMPALEYAELKHRAKIAPNPSLPRGIRNVILRRILMYLGDNAERSRRPTHEYTNGEEFRMMVTATPEYISVEDNGQGMSPERLEEVREAVRTLTPLKKSTHGGTGRGLVDVAIMLPQLFPKCKDPPTLEIQSTLGVGSVFIIHYRPMIKG